MPQTTTTWTTIETPAGPMAAYVASPAAPATSAVLVLQEAFGVNDHVQSVARRFADHGHLAVAPQLFHRTGTEVVGYDDHDQAMTLIRALGPSEVTADVTAALGYLQDAHGTGVERTAVVGFCFGGRAAFTAATAVPGLAATVVFYGPGIAAGPHAVLDRAGAITGPVLVHVGADDPTIPAEQVAAIDQAMAGRAAAYEQVVHAGAGHAFACDARPRMHQPQAAAAAWDQTFRFLDQHLAPAT